MKIGDKVRFLSETGGGVVAGFQGKNIVLVEDEDGFQIPTQTNDVVVVGGDDYDRPRLPASEAAGSPKPQHAEPAPPVETPLPVVERRGGDRLSVYLAFVPISVREISKTAFEVYVVNDSNYFVRFAWFAMQGAGATLRATGEVEPNTKLFVEEFDRGALGELEHVAVQLLAYKRDKPFVPKPAIDVRLRIDGVKFYKLHTFQENDFFEEPALIYTIVENDRPARPLVVDAKMLKQELYAPKSSDRQPARKPAPAGRQDDGDVVVVDLHADALLDTTAGMGAADILNYQMDRFHDTLKAYCHRKGQRIVFIHGKGEGVLRQSIIHELNYRYKAYPHQDASFREYGYGATQVTIR